MRAFRHRGGRGGRSAAAGAFRRCPRSSFHPSPRPRPSNLLRSSHPCQRRPPSRRRPPFRSPAPPCPHPPYRTPRAASPSTPGSSAVQPAGAQPTTGPSSAARASSRPAGTQAQARQSAARRRAVDTPRERRFRRSVRDLWACSYAVSDFERDVLVRRAGLEGFSATPTAAVASGRGLGRAGPERAVQRPPPAARRQPSRWLRDGLRGRGLGSSAQTLLAVATAPPLATDAGDAVAQGPSSTNDRIEVLGAQRESTGVKVATAPRATVTLAATGDGGTPPWPLLLILALLAAAAATPLLRASPARGRAEGARPRGLRAPAAHAPTRYRDPRGPFGGARIGTARRAGLSATAARRSCVRAGGHGDHVPPRDLADARATQALAAG